MTRRDLLTIILAGAIGVGAVMIFTFAFADELPLRPPFVPSKAEPSDKSPQRSNANLSNRLADRINISPRPTPDQQVSVAIPTQISAADEQDDAESQNQQHDGSVPKTAGKANKVIDNLAKTLPALQNAPATSVLSAVQSGTNGDGSSVNVLTAPLRGGPTQTSAQHPGIPANGLLHIPF